MSKKLRSQIESLLFIAARPVSVKEMAKAVKNDSKEVEAAADELLQDYKDRETGIQIIKNDSQFQMVSSPQNSKLVQEFIQDETGGELTRPSLETLTIIAYRSPISKSDLDRIRGVNCSLILRNLLLRGLVKSQKDKQKEETYYTVSMEFLRFLGVNDIKELPDYDKLSQDDTIDRILEQEEK